MAASQKVKKASGGGEKVGKSKLKKLPQEQVQANAATPLPKKARKTAKAETAEATAPPPAESQPAPAPAPASDPASMTKRGKKERIETEALASKETVAPAQPPKAKKAKKGKSQEEVKAVDDNAKTLQSDKEEKVKPERLGKNARRNAAKRRREAEAAQQATDGKPAAAETAEAQTADGAETGAKKRKKDSEAAAGSAKTEASKAEAPREEAPKEPVTYDDSFKVLVGGLSWTVTEEQLRIDFGSCGEVKKVSLLHDKATGQPKGLAFITYTSEEGVQAVLEFNGEEYAGRTLTVRKVDGEGKQREGEEKNAEKDGKNKDAKGRGKGKRPNTSVVIRGLAYEVTVDDLKDQFKNCGSGPVNVHLLTDRETGESRGMAFVDFKTPKAAAEAMEHTETELKGRTFFMEYVKKQAPEEIDEKGASEVGKEKDRKDKSKQGKEGKGKGKDSKDSKGKGKGKGKAPGSSVVVRKLAYEVTEEDLREQFKSCGGGGLVNVHLLTDRETGLSRGMAFLDFKTPEAANEAMKLTETELKGLKFFVEPKKA